MSALQEKHDTAEALYKAIRKEVEGIDDYRSAKDGFLVNLAHAYSMVAESHAGDPSKKSGRAV